MYSAMCFRWLQNAVPKSVSGYQLGILSLCEGTCRNCCARCWRHPSRCSVRGCVCRVTLPFEGKRFTRIALSPREANRMLWAEWCAKALGRIPFIANRSDARSTRCGRYWPAETLGVSRHHWLLIARQRKSLQVFILCTALESVAGRETSTATVPGTGCSVTENRLCGR